MYVKNQILFPPDVIPVLRESRGTAWAKLVEEVKDLPEEDARKLGFCLMMIRFNGCMQCETDSYRAMRGCDLCSLQTLRRFKGTDQELLQRYQEAQADIDAYLACAQRVPALAA